MVRRSALVPLSVLLAVAVVFALAAKSSAATGPVSADECKDGGWATFPDAAFTNGGESVRAGVAPVHRPSPAVTEPAGAPDPAAASVVPEAVRPVPGRTAVGAVRSGSVKVKPTGSDAFVPLADGAVPPGATIDATDGVVALETVVAACGSPTTTVASRRAGATASRPSAARPG